MIFKTNAQTWKTPSITKTATEAKIDFLYEQKIQTCKSRDFLDSSNAYKIVDKFYSGHDLITYYYNHLKDNLAYIFSYDDLSVFDQLNMKIKLDTRDNFVSMILVINYPSISDTTVCDIQSKLAIINNFLIGYFKPFYFDEANDLAGYNYCQMIGTRREDKYISSNNLGVKNLETILNYLSFSCIETYQSVGN